MSAVDWYLSLLGSNLIALRVWREVCPVEYVPHVDEALRRIAGRLIAGASA